MSILAILLFLAMGLQGEEVLFLVGAGGVAAGGAVGVDDAVAGDDDAHRVVVVGLSDGAAALGIAHAGGLLAIGDRLAVGDLVQLGPGTHLELGALDVQGQREVASLAIKVFV